MNNQSKILITGARGFLGRYVVEELHRKGYENLFLVENTHGQEAPHIKQDVVKLNLIRQDDVSILLYEVKPDVIIHLAARVGGIGANKSKPADFMYENLMMGLNTIQSASKLENLEKFVLVSTVCSYPHTPPNIPFIEEDIWSGFPEKTNSGYGIAKKTLMLMLQTLRQQYGFNGITLIPTNLYGPRDNFNDATSHVIPALIKKFDAAGTYGDIEIWGSGLVSREFLYASDAAFAIVAAAESYNEPEPLNIGNGYEIKISEVVDELVRIFGFKGNIIYNKSKPDGQPRRCLDTSKAREKLGFAAAMPFKDGLERTVAWYKENKHCLVQ